MLLGISTQAHAQPHLVTPCIRDAALNYTLINNPDYANELQEIIDSFGDSRPVVFIECGQIDGIYAYRSDEDDTIPTHNYIVYNPSFVNLATQNNQSKLIFLLGHEYAHISLGHFTDQKNLSLRRKELDADRKGACAVARKSGGDLNSLIEILSGMREGREDSGYPSLAESKEVVSSAYEQCRTQSLFNTQALPRSRVALFGPATSTTESVARSIDWLTSEAWNQSLPNILSLKYEMPNANVLPTQLSFAEIESMWQGDNSLLLVLKDSSTRSEASSTATGPTFSGLFYIGPFTTAGQRMVMNLGVADSFAEGVEDPARRNLILTDQIAAVALSYSALKYALETGQRPEIVLQFAHMTDLALRDLRENSGDIVDFERWTASLSKVDELLAQVRSSS